jgi:hypothetical protein
VPLGVLEPDRSTDRQEKQMRIRTIAGLSVAGLAAAGAVALGTAAYAAGGETGGTGTGSTAVVTTDESTAPTQNQREDCPDKGGSSGGGQTQAPESAPGTAAENL